MANTTIRILPKLPYHVEYTKLSRVENVRYFAKENDQESKSDSFAQYGVVSIKMFKKVDINIGAIQINHQQGECYVKGKTEDLAYECSL